MLSYFITLDRSPSLVQMTHLQTEHGKLRRGKFVLHSSLRVLLCLPFLFPLPHSHSAIAHPFLPLLTHCRSLPDETTNGDDQAGPSHREEAADDTGVNAGQGAQALQHTGGVNGTSDGSKEGDAAAAGGAGLKKIRVMEMCAGGWLCVVWTSGMSCLLLLCAQVLVASTKQFMREHHHATQCASFTNTSLTVVHAGVGGLSFLCQKGMGFDVEATWAVDIDDPAATAYQINHTQTHVSVAAVHCCCCQLSAVCVLLLFCCLLSCKDAGRYLAQADHYKRACHCRCCATASMRCS